MYVFIGELMKVGLYFALLMLLVGCVGKKTETSERANISQDIRDAMALCSSQFSAEQSLFLEGWYLEYDAQVKAGLVGASKGLVIDQSNMDGDQKLRLMEMYYGCVDSHAVKKKTLN